MAKGPYTFNNRPLVLKNWMPDFEIDKEPMRVMPLWVNFPGLPIQCWAEENLGRIASCLGKPVCTDRLTAECERISYARVLIEMDITQPMPDELKLEQKDGKIRVQSVEYEWKLVFCQECNKFGHPNGECKKEPQRGMQRKKDKKQQWVRKAKEDDNEEKKIPPEKEIQKEEESTQEKLQEVQIQIEDRGKQIKIYQGKPKTKGQPPIELEELTRRNKYAVLRIQEEPPHRIEKRHIQGVTKGPTPTTIPLI
ncbi:PREDICTED: uncharacterized protein LOC109239829 [Nicotiana attenuata]|uniref:uncharacterized protein LOC109239829 n=1 Tax=Nicotiana attenuata TaxID=49451 RepID=UPI000904AAD4|nr:PREDICTED: uncharacterized protein LOC109239829 [Nicotiana attenuata]